MQWLLSLVVAAAAPETREVGAVVLDNVPPIPAELAARTQQYQNVRGATLLDWSPRGDAVLISTRFGDTEQIHEVRAPMGARTQLTFFGDAVREAAYDPARPAAGFLYRIDVGGNELYQYHWLDRATGRSTLLTDGASRNESLVVAPNGRLVAVSSTRRNKKDFDVWLIPTADPSRTRIVALAEGKWVPIELSRDASKLLVQHYVSANESYLWLVDVASSERTAVNPRPGEKISYTAAALSPAADAIFFASDQDSEFSRLWRWDVARSTTTVLTPDLKWDVRQIAISKDGKQLAWAVNEGGQSALFTASTAKPAAARRASLPVGVAHSLRFAPNGKKLGFSLGTAESPTDVFDLDLASGKLTRWTASEVGGLDRNSFVPAELVEVKSFDGRSIPAWYHPPRSSAVRAPVLLVIHGGPESQAMPILNPTNQFAAIELGAAVLIPNVRGSSGYGKSYLELDNAERREDSVKDIGAFLDWIATRPELDPSRVAIMGGSYGGYMTLATLATYPERVRCGIDVVGITNFVTFLENTESYRRDLRRVEYGDERDPATRAFLERISPTTNAKKIRAPLLVAQGANDPRVPASEAAQIISTVRAQGGEVWSLLARDEGHGFAKKTNRDLFLNVAAMFLSRCYSQ